MIRERPLNKAAHDLLLEGTLVFTDMECTGFRVDVDYYRTKQIELEERLAFTSAELVKEHDVVADWKKRYGRAWSLGSDVQVAKLVYDICGAEESEDGRKTDEDHLRALDLPFIDGLIQWRKLDKVLSTYVLPYCREQVDGIVRPFFGLNNVRSYRPSGSDPNLLNVPKRNAETMELVRGGIYPHPGFQFLEVDYKAAEVRVGNCVHRDETMFAYNRDLSKDMHRDAADELFFLDHKVPKELRNEAKGWFVFAQFYGDYYKRCAENLWNAVVVADLCGMKEHMAAYGNTTLEQFTEHVRKFEDKFWNEWFTGYRDWKEKVWEDYCREGHVDLITGFRCDGVMDTKQITNMPIQGPAFHCLLWSLIQINKRLKSAGLKSRPWCMIYDSIVMHLWPPELDDVLDIVKPIMEDEVREHYKWLEIPMIAEFEIGRRDGSWTNLKEIEA